MSNAEFSTMRLKIRTLDRLKIASAASGVSYSEFLESLMDSAGIPKLEKLNEILAASMAIRSPLQDRDSDN